MDEQEIVILVQCDNGKVFCLGPLDHLVRAWKQARDDQDPFLATGVNGGKVVLNPFRIDFMHEIERTKKWRFDAEV